MPCARGPQCWGYAGGGANATFYDENCTPLYDLMVATCPGAPGNAPTVAGGLAPGVIVNAPEPTQVGLPVLIRDPQPAAPAAPSPSPQPGTTPQPGAVAVPFPSGAHYVEVSGRYYVVTDAGQGNSPEGWRVVVVHGLSQAYLSGDGWVRTGAGAPLGRLMSGNPPQTGTVPGGTTPGSNVPGETPSDPDAILPGQPGVGGPGLGGLGATLAQYKVPLLLGAGALVLMQSGLLSGGPKRRR